MDCSSLLRRRPRGDFRLGPALALDMAQPFCPHSNARLLYEPSPPLAGVAADGSAPFILAFRFCSLKERPCDHRFDHQSGGAPILAVLTKFRPRS